MAEIIVIGNQNRFVMVIWFAVLLSQRCEICQRLADNIHSVNHFSKWNLSFLITFCFFISFQIYFEHFCSSRRKVFIRCSSRPTASFMSRTLMCSVNCLWCLKATSCVVNSISPICSINSSINSIRKCSQSLIASTISTMSKCQHFFKRYQKIFLKRERKLCEFTFVSKMVVINWLMRLFISVWFVLR